MKCQSCEIAPATREEEAEDSSQAMQVCGECYQRLQNLSLRPLEWYNLAKRFGWWQYLLHDDFYDEDGTATCPEVPVEFAEDYPAPVLESVMGSAVSLLDYCITRWEVTAEMTDALHRLPKDELRVALISRFDQAANSGIRSVLLVLAGSTLREEAAEFVRDAWNSETDLEALAEASAQCLLEAEAFSKVTGALESLVPKERAGVMFCLAYFRSKRTLEWLERNVASPITDQWGRLAACSDFDWMTAKKWLEQGRPLSLVALDALAFIIRPNTSLGKRMEPTLLNPPKDTAQISDALNAYLERDSVPRVKKRVEFVLGNLEKLG